MAFRSAMDLVGRGESTEREPPCTAVAAIILFLGLIIPIAEQSVLADVLKYSLLPVVVLAAWKSKNSSDTPRILRWSALNVVATTALLLAHNDSVAFVVANAIMVVAPERTRVRAATGAIVAIVPLTIWALVRHALLQSGSHPIALGAGRYAPSTYLLRHCEGPAH
jgi:hypothetical protein